MWNSTSGVTLPTLHHHRWTSRTSTTGLMSWYFIQPSLEIEDIILRYFRACYLEQNDQMWPTLSSLRMSTQPRLRAQRDQADQRRHRTSGWIPQPLPAHQSTSAGYRCDQLQDCARHACFLAPMTRLTTIGRESTSGRTSTSQPS